MLGSPAVASFSLSLSFPLPPPPPLSLSLCQVESRESRRKALAAGLAGTMAEGEDAQADEEVCTIATVFCYDP